MSRKERIQEQLSQKLCPVFLSVEDESKNHHVPEGAETHFKVIVATPQFAPLTRIARHRLINQLLSAEFDSGLHALSMYLYTPEEWDLQDKSILNSPSCKDGYKN